MSIKILNWTVALQEVPDEISIVFNCTGCPIKCKGCHSKELQDINNGYYLYLEDFKEILKKYKNKATCVCFMGGEWFDINEYLKESIKYGYKTALYTGLSEDRISIMIKENLNYLKSGRYSIKYGGLNNINTNQIFKNLKTGEILNYKFI